MRLIAFLPLIAAAAGCGPRVVPEPPAPSPAAETAPPALPVAAARRPPPPPVDHDRPVPICVLRDGALRMVPARYDSRSGDTTTLEGLPFSSAWPLTGEYAVVAGWYVDREPITFRARRYTMHGAPRVLGINEIARAGEHRGVPVFVEAGDTGAAPATIYLPHRPGCEFQPYVSDTRR